MMRFQQRVVRTCGYLNSVEIINIETVMGHVKRGSHRIGTLNIKNQPRIAVFGGVNDDSKTRRENSIEIFEKRTLK